MQSIGPSGNTSEASPHRWGQIVGATIAIVTLTLPISIIAYYSSDSNIEYAPGTVSTLPKNNN